MDVTPEHPYYVYGQGWASCDPDASMQIFGLKCQQLQVGDVCISLYADNPKSPSSSLTQNNQINVQSSHFNYQTYYNRDDLNHLPQNLSRRTQTIPTTATGTTVTSRPHMNDCLTSYATHLNDKMCSGLQTSFNERSSLNHSNSSSNNNNINSTQGQLIGRSSGISDDRRLSSNHMIHSQYESTGRSMSHDGRTMQQYNITDGCNMSISNSVTTSRPSSNHAASTAPVQRTISEEEALESASRKRRWSAPDNICDDEGCPPNVNKH